MDDIANYEERLRIFRLAEMGVLDKETFLLYAEMDPTIKALLDLYSLDEIVMGGPRLPPRRR
jgi:hypothetical protein